LLKALIEYKKKVKEAEAEGVQRPRIDNYIGLAIIKIAENLANKGNFSNYPFRDDMIADGIENCIVYINNFNPDKSNNPFAYFTTIIWRAYVRRIRKEKRYLYIKYKTKHHYNIMRPDDEAEIESSEASDEYENEFIRNYEEKEKKSKIGKSD
jgi:DNA-directed RNA polymerase specialized sigma24 family protein